MSHISDYFARIASEDRNGFVQESQIPIHFPEEETTKQKFRLLSLFSGCGGMDIGFEGGFIAPQKEFLHQQPLHKPYYRRKLGLSP